MYFIWEIRKISESKANRRADGEFWCAMGNGFTVCIFPVSGEKHLYETEFRNGEDEIQVVGIYDSKNEAKLGHEEHVQYFCNAQAEGTIDGWVWAASREKAEAAALQFYMEKDE